MLILRIKQAEHALADGRLDEAYDIVAAREKDLRGNRGGQELAGELARAAGRGAGIGGGVGIGADPGTRTGIGGGIGLGPAVLLLLPVVAQARPSLRPCAGVAAAAG